MRTVTITGGQGFLGTVLARGLAARDYHIDVFDRSVQPADDILADRELLVRRFSASDAVIHLAGIPHPHYPGATEADFLTLNYDGAINVFEAAREAGVARFVFASSAQVYKINDPVRLEQFPVLESNYLPLPAEGQSTYGFLKAAVERYLAGACAAGRIQSVALRLESPGLRSREPWNFYVSTSIENLIAGVLASLAAPIDFGFEAFNIADPRVSRRVADVQRFIASRWPYVPNHTTGNESLLSIEKARRLLGYAPRAGGRYVSSGRLRRLDAWRVRRAALSRPA